MIKKITINNYKSYTEKKEISDLKRVNFFFGSNGSGKTTISQVIARRTDDPIANCNVDWENNEVVKTIVFNRDFIEENFATNKRLLGIYTIGENSKKIENEIESLEGERDELHKEKKRSNEKVEKLKSEIPKIESEFLEHCWDSNKEDRKNYKFVFSGHLNVKKKFTDYLISEIEKLLEKSGSIEEVENLDQLKESYNPVNENELMVRELIPKFPENNLDSIAGNEIFKKALIGSKDLQLGRVYEKLKNMEWANSGKKFIAANNGNCPFCQQKMSELFLVELNEIFDNNYAESVAELESLLENYRREKDTILKTVREILKQLESDNSDGISSDAKSIFEKSRDELGDVLDQNIESIKNKIEKHDLCINLQTINKQITQFDNEIDNINKKIEDDNDRISSSQMNQDEFRDEFWKCIAKNAYEGGYVNGKFNSYQNFKNQLDKSEQKLSDEDNLLKNIDNALEKNRSDISKLELTRTSMAHTVLEINKKLKSFGISSFKLDNDKDDAGCFSIIREYTNETTKEYDTLSEGEKTIITFLYFYFLINGSLVLGEKDRKCVVVFDDPISSLDSHFTFIVSSLIQEIINEVYKSNDSHIKQVFVFTHNLYFHNEVTLNLSKGDKCETSFWIVRKTHAGSDLTPYIGENPISSTYETLWWELNTTTIDSKRFSISIQNTIRKILETYFIKLCGFERLACLKNKFKDEDINLKFKNLLSWSNSGSHGDPEEIYASISPEEAKMYIKYLEDFFESMGHKEHFNMMMAKVNPDRKPKYKEE